MKYLKRFEQSTDDEISTFYKIYNGEDFLNLSAVLYRICKNEKEADSLISMFKKDKGDYKYVITTIISGKIRYTGWMYGGISTLDWFKDQEYINGGMLVATPEEIEKYKLKQGVNNYNL